MLKINPDMSVALSYQDRAIDLPKRPPLHPLSIAVTTADVGGDDNNDDNEWNQFFEHHFCDIKERDVIAGTGIKRQHPTTMLLISAIVEPLLLSHWQ